MYCGWVVPPSPLVRLMKLPSPPLCKSAPAFSPEHPAEIMLSITSAKKSRQRSKHSVSTPACPPESAPACLSWLLDLAPRTEFSAPILPPVFASVPESSDSVLVPEFNPPGKAESASIFMEDSGGFLSKSHKQRLRKRRAAKSTLVVLKYLTSGVSSPVFLEDLTPMKFGGPRGSWATCSREACYRAAQSHRCCHSQKVCLRLSPNGCFECVGHFKVCSYIPRTRFSLDTQSPLKSLLQSRCQPQILISNLH